MKAYNIYYKNEKLNKSPLNHKGLVEVFKRNTIKKQSGNGIVSIPTKDCNTPEIKTKINYLKTTIILLST